MTSQLERDLAGSLARRRVLGGLAAAVGAAGLAACNRAGAQAGAICAATPTEIKGPFPADGTNGRLRPINVLTMDGVVRQDIRSSFAGLEGQAEGVPLELDLTVLRSGDCAPIGGFAVYLWQNDAAGAYSLYNLPEANYLRGLQAGSAQEPASFTSIVPGCYGGRYPHCHFEVFASTEAALGGEQPLLVSQLGFPEADCRAIYETDARYGDSIRNLQRMPLERDFVFADTGGAGQIVTMTGDPDRGYRAAARILLA